MFILFSSTPKIITDYFHIHKYNYILVKKSDLKISKFWKKVSKISKFIKLGIIYNFGAIIPNEIIQKFPFVNIHFSLLPKYRGAVPVEAAILNGDKKTGITIHKTVAELDAGDIILQKAYGIPREFNSKDLWNFLESKLPEVLDEFLAIDLKLWPSFQQEGDVSYTYKSMLQKDNAYIDFYSNTAIEILHRVKAFFPEPIAWVKINFIDKIKVLHIYDAEIPTFHDLKLANLKPGQLLWYKRHGLVVGTLCGSILLKEISIENKKHLKEAQILSLKGKIKSFF